MPSQYIKCVDCKTEFEYPEGDQEFYRDRGFSAPKRCLLCRKAKKARFGNDDRQQQPRRGRKDHDDLS